MHYRDKGRARSRRSTCRSLTGKHILACCLHDEQQRDGDLDIRLRGFPSSRVGYHRGMTTMEILVAKAKALPPEGQREVLDFVEFLETRLGQVRRRSQSEKKIRSARRLTPRNGLGHRPTSASNPEMTSNSSSSMPLWRKRWKEPLRLSSKSSMFLSARSMAARRFAFSLARDSAHARKSEMKR